MNSPATSEDRVQGRVDLIDVVRVFGSERAVDCLNLTINPGEFLSLLGPSGCGKTTTLRMLAGFDYPDEGEILLSGKPVGNSPPDKRDINTVFQSYALFPHMSVAENVAFGLRERRVDKAQMRSRVGEALEMVQMTALAGRRPQNLSGGQQQRVALARALVNRPSVLLLDEPLAALDRKLREQMQVELKLLQTELQMTFVFVTHDQGEALSMSDRIAVMLDGRIQQLADPNTIYEHPVSAFVAGFIGQQNFLEGLAAPNSRTVRGDDWTISMASPFPNGVVDGERVLAAVRPESVSVTSGPVPDGMNAITGRLRGVAHLGVNVQLVVQISRHHEVLSIVPRHALPPLEIGMEVNCTWSPAQTQVFPIDDAQIAALSTTH